MIAWKHIDALRHELGEDDFKDVVAVFLEEVEGALAKLASGLEAGDQGAMLHFLKGSALNLGFEAFAGLCETGEAALRQGRPDGVDLSRLNDIYSQSRSALLQGLSDTLRPTG